MEGSFSFDATPMAPPGTEVLIHLKPNRRQSWSFHASNAWYIGPSLKHYRCIRSIMASTGGERLTDTFRFKHHVIRVPVITATDRIIKATAQLTNALAGVQEAPPDELQAIQALRVILLGEELPTPIQTLQTTQAPNQSKTLHQPPVQAPIQAAQPTPPISIEEEPIYMWNPNANTTTANTGTPEQSPITANGPAIIEDDSIDNPPPQQQQRPRTRAQHQRTNAHIINAVISQSLMPQYKKQATTNYTARGYVAATQALLENMYGVNKNATSTSTMQSTNFIGAIIDEDTGDTLEYRHLIKSDKYRTIWQHSFANKLGRLFQGIRDIKGTNTCFFIPKHKVPKHKRATYGRICCNYRPQKDEPHRTQLTVGGDRIDYAGNKSTPTADLVTAKLLINSTISTPKAIFYSIDLANFYLMTPMEEFEYMRLRIEIIPEEIIQKYNLQELVDD